MESEIVRFLNHILKKLDEKGIETTTSRIKFSCGNLKHLLFRYNLSIGYSL
jgi:hypothetical protein